ncbi:hypothetical protein K504DRAFT_494877 [Pleomassaria siparia CBS 279.74]|uniref:Chitin-binding type-2 domain-containing protein n=1 Tax=Pleomassaria siparia CBS 279.74 TaxID=1314801 RepID=A0A6G1JWT9_9PLEO|nr:hypothetical protein K504DRAFT_494877 [Pleomassaria siparia CBS 279.74]
MASPTVFFSFLWLLCLTLAAPQVTVTVWPPGPSLPTVCDVSSDNFPCPYGYICSPQVTRYCPELEAGETCGYCSSIAPPPSTTPTPQPQTTSTATATATATTKYCHDGSIDYRHMCHTTTSIIKISTSTTTVRCPDGFTHDYRFACRTATTVKVSTSTFSSSSGGGLIIPSFTPTPTAICSPGSTTDYRGRCWATPTPPLLKLE